LAACSAKQQGPEAPAAGERWVATVTIHGNKTFSDTEILDGLVTAKPSGYFVRRRVRFDPALVALDRSRIETYYKQRGFFEVIVPEAQIKERQGLATEVRFFVTEGRPSRISAVEIDGVEPKLRDSLFRGLGLKVGKRFDYESYDLRKESILSTMRESGYAHALLTATATADPSTRSVVLRYEVVPGPVVHIGEIKIVGLSTIPESAVRHRIAFAPGDRFSTRRINETRDQLRSLGRFGTIRIDFSDQAVSEIGDVTITLREGPRRELRLGLGSVFDGGLSLDNAQWLIRARAGHVILGFIDPLTSLEIEVRPGLSIQTGGSVRRSFVGEARIGLTREDLLLPELQGEVRLSYNRLAFDNFTTQGPRASIGLRRPLWHRRIQLGLSYNAELLCFSDRPALFDPADDTGEYDASVAEALGVDRSCSSRSFPKASSYRLGYVEGTLALDGRDSVIETRRGYYLEARVEQASAALGGEFGYLSVAPQARAYMPLSKRVVLGARVQYGRTLSGNLPVTRRYFAGGASSQRGFGQRQLAPVVGDLETSSIEIGGDEVFEASVEARIDLFPIYDWLLGLALFTDAGDVGLEAGDVDLMRLHFAPGVGLRYHTPIGPARFDVAYRATRRGAGEVHAGDSFAWHLSIGEAF
jgi:translocation and assembly module TamA